MEEMAVDLVDIALNGTSLSDGSLVDCLDPASNGTFMGNSTVLDSLLGWSGSDDSGLLCPSNDSEIHYKDPSYYAIPYRIIGTIFQGFILLIGVLGNIMVVIVVVRTRSMKTPTNCYLVSLSMADLMVLLSAVPNEILSYYVLGEQWVWGRLGCALFIFCQYLGINASSLSITAFTIERYIAICHPMKAQKVCTVHRAKNIITGVWVFAVIYCSPWLFLTKTEPVFYRGRTGIETCTFALSRQFYKGYFFADLILFYVFPLVLSCILYGFIARILFSDTISKSVGSSSSKSTGASTSTSAKNGGQATGGGGKGAKEPPAPSEAKKSSSSSSDSARVQVVKMLVVVVATFATLWLPYRALLVYNSFADHRYMELWYLMFCKTMIFVNSAINPILYNALSVKFRRAFKRMLCCEDAASAQYRMRGNFTSTLAHQVGGPAGGHGPNSRNANASTLTTCTIKTSCRSPRNEQNVEHVV